MKTRILISTETFPYGNGEKTFIMPELERLKEIYDVTIISHAGETELKDIKKLTRIDSDIKIININKKLSMPKRIWYFFRFFFDIDGWKEFFDILKCRRHILSRVYQSIGFYALAMENYKKLNEEGVFKEKTPTIYYTFWFYYYTYSLTKNICRHNNIKIITRVHGFDLYNERYSGGRQPFKQIMLKKVDKVFFISEAGRKYFQKIYEDKYNSKFFVNRLGTKRAELSNPEKVEGEWFRIVSCSSVIELKRIELIVEALAQINEECIEWVHFGDGNKYDEISKYANQLLNKKDNIRYSFYGFWSNDRIMEYYQNVHIDCFITTSSTEGIPISIQEAMSVGIPIVGTGVGGIPEMIDGNGILLCPNPTSTEIVTAIRKVILADTEEMKKMRAKSIKVWNDLFCSEKNIREFIVELEKQVSKCK